MKDKIREVNMDDYIKKVYDMLYSPILTPYNLLDNAKLDNYDYVKYYKGESGLIAEMKCKISANEEKVYYYCFDENDHLQRIYTDGKFGKALLFDRNQELEETKNDYYEESVFLENVV